MNAERAGSEAYELPPLCYIRHVTTGETVLIRRGVLGYEPANTTCSPACLNAKLPRVPNEDEISAMQCGSILGWTAKGADPETWQRRREQHS